MHFAAAKRVLRYIQGIMSYGIQYSRNSQVNLTGFYDSDFGGCVDDKKSTSGYAFSIGLGTFSWCSKKQ